MLRSRLHEEKKYPIQAFEDSIFLTFEGTEVPIPVGYDAYLSTAFGDYMNHHTADKQVPHHDAVIADMDKAYTEYKGVYNARKN